MNLHYSSERTLSADEYIGLLRRTSLGERRPLDDRERIGAMLARSNLLCTAWDGPRLVGAARSVTDFVYCCYLSDLAVDEACQRQGVGRALIRLTQSRLDPRASLILLAAPQAVDYYPRLGFSSHPSAWVIGASQPLREGPAGARGKSQTPKAGYA